jgi:hypothetical protein
MPVDVLEMGSRQIGVYHLQHDLSCGPCETHRRVAARVARDRLAVQRLLVGEVVVEAAARQPGARHDLIDRDRLEAVAVEHAPGAFDDARAGLLLMHR